MPKKLKMLGNKKLLEAVAQGCIFSNFDDLCEVIATAGTEAAGHVGARVEFSKLEALIEQDIVETSLCMFPGCCPGWYYHGKGNLAAAHYKVSITYVNRPADRIVF